ncbi:hypothetical protein UFOVP71_415 [uncultured Caudovirales phage]|uniref:Uncharacterized protein n=1 Tax=uncultured Caudovirales phage TaxID=2100421 RepID=A0A6J5TD71_9CAUD|nr:hypothetical protein UFOVP71_415 [uncultured Caudovirales phage]
MKPIDPPEALSVWVVASLTSTGSMSHHSPQTVTTSTFPGYYTSLEDAQQEQMILALKGTKAHVFQLDFPRP